ncbi:MAG: acyl carrier protein, partial [Limnobacter sp.]|nr:acyl carrier protein [Limnobacter sp.]
MNQLESSSIQHTIVTTLADLLRADTASIDVNSPLLELGADSLIFVEVIRSLDKTYGVKLSVRELFEELTTVEALVQTRRCNTESSSRFACPSTTATPKH